MPSCRMKIAAILALALLAPAGPVSASRIESDRAYTAGRDAESRNAPGEALGLFRKAVEENPDNHEARYHLAVLYSRNINTYGQAEELLLDLPGLAMRQGSGSRDDLIFRAGLALGQLYAKSGRNPQAIRLVRNVIAAAPDTVALDEAYTVLGLSLYHERAYEEALFELRRATKLNPNNTAATFNLKTIRTRLEHFNAARIYSRMGDHLGAIGEYRAAIRLDPRFIEARYRLGLELILNGDQAEALKELRRAESVSGNYRKMFEIHYAKGIALRDLGEADAAMREFEKTVRVKPRHAQAYNEIGKLLLLRKEYRGAVQKFAQAIEIDARDEYARNLQKAIVGDASPGG